MQTLGQRVKQRRIQLGYRAKYVAKEVGLSAGGLSLFENGHTSGIDFVTGVKLAKLLQLDPESLALGLETCGSPEENKALPIIGDQHSGPTSDWFDIAIEDRPLATEVIEIHFDKTKAYYGLKITENTGRYLDGEAIILDSDPFQALLSGNDVFVVYQRHCQLMHFLYERGGKVHLIGFEKDSHMLIINRDECQYLHSVVAIVTNGKIKKM
ncbi:helix-turn-helix domain-containing protein [Shewanella surugensis]|uniref:Helix-turn-helix domain-containing protein n=1 Tax=Shewanella surugensis TaxID=212020 RepID=A0ABT0LD46_9GAMM|nr:helix-turn-helix domain-containing protein [Shewanella surugensis]MCL1125608.1 helix-turn-helix domain-containing protein [Shewanella surugensis]